MLVLEDGRTFTGRAYGAVGRTVGEIVFNTGMTGYQETLTDPSYHRQIVVMTAPHVGNTGVNGEDDESHRIWVSGFVVRDPALRPSSWRSTGSLEDELERQFDARRAGSRTTNPATQMRVDSSSSSFTPVLPTCGAVMTTICRWYDGSVSVSW